MARIVVALGGNALGNTPAEQREKAEKAAETLAGLIEQGHEIVVAHGNGPQVGMINLGLSYAAQSGVIRAEIPFPECGAMSQGYIGYHLQNAVLRALRERGLEKNVCTVVTQVEVDAADPAFQNPSKPVGAFYSEAEAAARMAAGDGVYQEDAGRGWRRVVPSPQPVDIVEKESVLSLLRDDFVVVACGGGGIPVVRDSDDLGCYRGVPAVIEKDAAAGLLGDDCDADEFVFLTDVDGVAINWQKPDQRFLDDVTVPQIHAYANAGEFGHDDMEPKVRAALRFLEQRPDRVVRIGNVRNAAAVVRGESGTCIHY